MYWTNNLRLYKCTDYYTPYTYLKITYVYEILARSRVEAHDERGKREAEHCVLVHA